MATTKTLLQIVSAYFDFVHVVVMKKLVFAVIPFNTHAGPIAGCDRTLVRRAGLPSHALADFQFF